MRSHFRWIYFAAFLFAAVTARAANPVPGLEVVALRGSTVVFRGVTDGKGRFDTGPLAPGVYSIEVRTVRNTPPTSARFFLSLAGAKPLGDAVVGPGVALAMYAKVRNPSGIRGQVSARGGIVYVPLAVAANNASINNPRPPANPAAARPTATPIVSAANQRTPRALVTSPPAAPKNRPDSTFVRRPAGSRQKIMNGQRYSWMPITAGSNLGRWIPDNVSRPAPTAAPASNPPATKPSPTPSRARR